MNDHKDDIFVKNYSYDSDLDYDNDKEWEEFKNFGSAYFVLRHKINLYATVLKRLYATKAAPSRSSSRPSGR